MKTHEEDKNINRISDTRMDIVDVILQQLSLLDQAASEKELNNSIPLILESIGDYTNADRVYIFDWYSEEHDSYTNTFEWCREGVTPQKENLQHVPVELMCNWQEQFLRGRTVMIPDVEAVRETMPYEYVMLKQQQITSVIAVPLFANNRVNGFIGVDNPEDDMNQMSSKLLADIAGHLSCLRENLNMLTLLEQKQESLQQSLKELKREKKLLDALCTDYTSVYYCDLSIDRLEFIKQDELLYPGWKEKMNDEGVYSYSASIRYYYDHYVIRKSAPDFLKKLSARYLIKYLTEEPRMTYRYRAKANPAGHEFFEVQVVRTRVDDEGFRVVMGYRYIDDIVQDEERQKRKLEKALTDTKMSNEIISAISKNYSLIYRMDLEKDLYEEVTSEADMYRLTGRRGKISVQFDHAREEMVAPEFQVRMKEFLDISTLADRLENTESVATEYLSSYGNWYECCFIVKRRDETGRVTNVLYAVRGINEQKRQELDYQKQLMKAAEEARRANIAKTDFLRRMSHDVRTPINGIKGLLEIAGHYPDDLEKQKEYREKLQHVTGVLLELVNRVLDMNKLESGEIRLEEKPFNLRKLIFGANELVKAQAMEYGVHFYAEDGGITHENLIGSPMHVQQIWLNVLTNAVLYNHSEGEVRVKFREIRASRDEAVFEFVCEDTGRGMSEAFQQRIYEPFSQEARNARTNYTGTGLGLTIVKELVDYMGGTIRFTSKINEGTCFTITLPFAIDNSDAYKTIPDDAVYPYDALHVLLVEDNETNMEIAEFMLQNKGIRVTKAWNGQEAVQLFSHAQPETYDAILMDIMMPVMGGLEATRKIRSLGTVDASTVPIFAMTANAFIDDIEKSKAAGMNEHLTKPLELDKILTAIRKYCRKKAE